MNIGGKTLVIAVFGALVLVAHPAEAHRSGCHRWHSCPSDSGSYTCGDAGYPCRYPTYSESNSSASSSSGSSSSVLGVTTFVSDYISTYLNDIPGIVNQEFLKIFGRLPTAQESAYWKGRIRSTGYDQIGTRSKLRAAMGWHKSNGSAGTSAVAGIQSKRSPDVVGSRLIIYDDSGKERCDLLNPKEPRSEVIKHLDEIYKCVTGKAMTSEERTKWQKNFANNPELITRARLASAIFYAK